MSEVWTKWEGQVVDGVFPLRRCLGVSDHSGVFLTEDPTHNLPNAALKLVPAIPTLAELQLAHWNAAASLTDPRLVRLFATGRCQLGNLHCLYVVMEYAEQNLAHFLANRPLTEDEVLELLPPTLDALAFLHSRDLVHGQLKPSNVLVVADQLKLATDNVRPAGEAATSISMQSVYDPPEGRDGSFSTAGDIWALGVTLYEALTRSLPQKPDDRSHGVALPPDFPPRCADVIRECLSRRPSDRPSVASLQAWVSRGIAGVPAGRVGVATAVPGQPGGAPVQPTAAPGHADAAMPRQGAAPVPPSAAGAAPNHAANTAAAVSTAAPGVVGQPLNVVEPIRTSTPGAMGEVYPNESPGRLTIRAVVERGEPPTYEPPARRSFGPLALAAIVIAAVAWGAVRLFGGHRPPSPGANVAAAPAPSSPAAPASDATSDGATSNNATSNATTSNNASSNTQAQPSTHNGHPSASDRHPPASNGQHRSAGEGADVVHEELPNVSRGALATIHGHVRVTVRVSVDASGAVVEDSFVNPGPSRYFARAASQAAKKWRFAPAADQPTRHWILHFEFSRGGTAAHASTKS
jgi:serine/threonine-protein kinase